jgi:hypothetical protein
MDAEVTQDAGVTQEGSRVRDETTLVANWRLEVLLEAGYNAYLAEQIADSDADLHLATALVAQGCSPKLAARILI